MRIWSNKEIEFLRNNYKKMKYKDISKKLDRSLGSIWYKCHELDLIQDKWSKRKVINCLKIFERRTGLAPSARNIGIPLLKACERYFGSLNNAKKAAKLEIKLNKNILPHSAYSSSKELAYITGLVLGDGSLRFQKSKERTSYVIFFSSKDKDLMESFVDSFKAWSNYIPKIYMRHDGWRKFPSGSQSYYHKNFCTQISFQNAYFVIKKFKDDPLYCIHFFHKNHYGWLLKGLWDAEGSIRINNKSLRIHFANKDTRIINLYTSLLDFHGVNWRKNTYRDGCFDISISDIFGTLEFIRIMDGITIKRKLKPEIRKFLELKEKEFKNFNPSHFNQKVYELTKQIPKGRVTTYSLIAKQLGCKAYRAVGNALNRNPYAPYVPCHRVVNNNGKIGGFASGLKNKTKLLQKEGNEIRNNRVVNFEKVLFKFK